MYYLKKKKYIYIYIYIYIFRESNTRRMTTRRITIEKHQTLLTFDFDQYLSDFDDFCTIRMPLRGGIRMVQKSSKSDKY